MITVNAVHEPAKPAQCQSEIHADFMPLKAIVERHARIAFRHLAAADRDEATSEALAATYASFVRLKIRGRDPAKDFPTRLAICGVWHVQRGRHIGGHTNAKDVMCWKAQRRHNFRVHSLTGANRRHLCERRVQSQGQPDTFEEILQENMRSSPADQAAFRVDFPIWLATRGQRDRERIHDLILGERTTDIAKKYRISLGRVSQKRRQLHRAWEKFHDEQPVDADAAVA